MNEAETRAELIDPKLHESGWGVVEGTKVSREEKVKKVIERVWEG
jgi:type I restriction enzyme R subunit